jgi:hypothetical protein
MTSFPTCPSPYRIVGCHCDVSSKHKGINILEAARYREWTHRKLATSKISSPPIQSNQCPLYPQKRTSRHNTGIIVCWSASIGAWRTIHVDQSGLGQKNDHGRCWRQRPT